MNWNLSWDKALCHTQPEKQLWVNLATSNVFILSNHICIFHIYLDNKTYINQILLLHSNLSYNLWGTINLIDFYCWFVNKELYIWNVVVSPFASFSDLSQSSNCLSYRFLSIFLTICLFVTFFGREKATSPIIISSRLHHYVFHTLCSQS